MPEQRGGKIPVMVYIDPLTFGIIEKKRGDVKRSTYLEKIIKANAC
jgi:hypothetical protein